MKSNRRIGGLARVAAATAILAFGATGAFAQSKVLVEIKAPPAGQDPHPITYFWEGENEPIKKPAQYYTYYYTGTVLPDATVPLGEEIQRVAVPNNDWQLQKAELIQYLTRFYEEAYNIVADNQTLGNEVVFDEDYNYVEKEKPQQGPLDPRAAAEWTFYYDQFVLWQFYCRRVLLNDKEASTASGDRESLQRQVEAQQLQGFEGIDVNEVLKAAEELRAGEEGAAAAAAGAPDAPKVATEFDPEADYADPFNNLIFRDEFVKMAEEREEDSVSAYTEMLTRIDARASENQRIQEWVEDKNTQLRDFAKAWGTVQAGESLYLEDTFVLVTEEPLDALPYGSINVIKRDRITPGDLIEPSGSLKKSEY